MQLKTYLGTRINRTHLILVSLAIATVFLLLRRDLQFLTRVLESAGQEKNIQDETVKLGLGRLTPNTEEDTAKEEGRGEVLRLSQDGYEVTQRQNGLESQNGERNPHYEEKPGEPLLWESTERVQNKTNPIQEQKTEAEVLETEQYRDEKIQAPLVHAELDSNIVWVGGNGSFLERIQNYVQKVDEERAKIVQKQSLNITKWVPLAGPIHSVWGNDDDTIYKLKNSTRYPFVRTVALEWVQAEDFKHAWTSLEDFSNFVIQVYYEWVGTEPLCSWIRTEGFTKARWDAAYNRTCNTEPDLSTRPKSLDQIYLNCKPINPSHYWPNNGLRYPAGYYTDVPKHVFYVHIVQSAVIDGVGDVFTNNLKIVPYTCSHNPSPKPPGGFMDTAIYNEVFVITQYWGEAFFHKMIESIPRIAPYIEFLKAHPNILIHAAEQRGHTAKVLKFLGLNPWRLISGICRAKLVYLPQGTYCGFPHVQELQVLSHTYRSIISETYPQMERNSVVMIRRTGTRKFSQYSEIEDIVKTLSEQYKFRYEIFPDNPVLPFEDTMQLFNRAIMVVGPHGAGLSNLVFSYPGTVVIEGVCNPPHVNMCYQRTAHILGHKYHGVPSRGGSTAREGGCETVVDINPNIIGEIVETHMKLLKGSDDR